MESTNIHTYQSPSPSPTYALAISPSPTPTLAVGTFLENLSNQISLLTFSPSPPSFSPSLSFPHPYPPTKILFHPLHPHLLASSSDSLRLWNLSSSSTPRNVFSSNSTAPFTSFDWNPSDPRLIAAASIDTTCTVWDVERSVIETQLIAHDKEVYDVVWGDKGVFASVSADGSVRMFDLRDKEHSTIVYESDFPLLRLAWSGKYMAVTVMDGSQVVVLDIRAPAAPVAELQRHQGSVNAIAWAPRSAGHVCSVADDGQALIWDVRVGAGPEGIDPVLAYDAGAEINQVQWSAAHPDWITIAFADKVQLLKV